MRCGFTLRPRSATQTATSLELGRVAGSTNPATSATSVDAARFVCDDGDGKPVARLSSVSTHVVDRWIVSRLGEAIAKTYEASPLPASHGCAPRCTNSTLA